MSKWVAYRVEASGMTSLRPGGKRVFGDKAKKWLELRAKALHQEIEVKPYVVTLPFGQITEHFSWDEFACHDGSGVPQNLRGNAIALAHGLEKLRSALGGHSLPLLSVYRTPSYNVKVHGASQSKHLQALAADLNVPAIMSASGLTHDQVLQKCESIPDFHGIGIYPDGAIHVDVRPGSRVFWNDWVRT